MHTHNYDLLLMTIAISAIVTLNVLAVVTGAAEPVYGTITDMIEPLMMAIK